MFKLLERLCDFIEEIKVKYPDTPLERGGDIEYANGNDGTDFDWGVNEHLCEFGCGYDDGRVWAFKVLIDTEGEAVCYCYPNGEPKPVEIIKKQLLTSSEMKAFYEYMLNTYDRKHHWDCFVWDVEE